MTSLPVAIDYIHIDDHKHNDLTARFLYRWLQEGLSGSGHRRVYFRQLNIIPLRHYIKDDEMVSERKTKKQTANTSAEWRGFVNVELNDEEWKTIDLALKDKKVAENVPAHLDYLLELGKVTFNYGNGSLVCSLTVLEGKQAGFTVSSFSDSLIEALLTTRLKVQNYLQDFEALAANGGQKRRRG